MTATATRSVASTAVIGALSLLAALLVAVNPISAFLVAFLAGVVAFLALAHDAPLARLLVLATLAASASVDLIRRLELGPTTAYAWLTGMVALSAGIVALTLWTTSVPPAGRRALAFMMLFPTWVLATAAWAPPDTHGAQNILVYVAVPAIATVSAVATATGALPFTMLRRALFWTFSAGSVLYGASLLLDGPGGGAIVGARPYALFAAIGVGWTAALGRHGYRSELRLALAMLALTFLSLSRTGFAVALVVLVCALIAFDSVPNVGRTLTLFVAIGLLTVVGLNYANPFAERFSEPDVVALPGGIGLSVSGRGKLWRATWESALHSPFTGQGAGSADVAVTAVDEKAGHPHNDYLRVFHDFGLVGVALLGCALVVPLLAAVRQLGHTRPGDVTGKAVHRAAILAITALGLEMVTDNSLVYGFVVIPVAVIVGASLGTTTREATEPVLRPVPVT